MRQMLRNRNIGTRFTADSSRVWFSKMMTVKNSALKFRLRVEEAAGAGIKRLVHEQICAAVNELQQSSHNQHAVHAARKHLKKVRALLRLVSCKFEREQLQSEKQSFRDAAGAIAPLRDATVRLKTFETLAGRDEKFPLARSSLQSESDKLYENASAPMREAATLLSSASARVNDWPVENFDARDLRNEIRRAYKKARRALDVAREDSSQIHAWRKRVKTLWYALRIFRDLLPGTAGELTDKAEILGEIAGNQHDLVMLREKLCELPGCNPLLDKIDAHDAELRQRAIDLGTQFFAEKPRAFARMLDPLKKL